ncbi:sensor domain-containing phosphodiesterase [Oxalobacteraceae bacterium CAVE-383]|nr:sensor domain-containing phosphodiesterase [Oxalobacteraceae bacterium CAVE-383]
MDAAVESGRLAALHRLEVVNGNTEDLDTVTRLVASHFDVPTSYISLIDSDRQWLKSRFGVEYEIVERDASFCTHTVAAANLLVIEDTTLDSRFCDNPLVTGPAQIRFYAGAPLITPEGYAIGALCLMDRQPRRLDAAQRAHLQELAAFVMSHILLRRTVGRVDPVSGMPNKYQLAEDLAALQKAAAGQRRVLAYVDMPDTSSAFEIATVLGVAVYDKLVRNVSQKIKDMVDGAADVYHIGDTRFGLLSRHGDTAAFCAQLRGLDLLAPVESMNVPINLLSFGGILDFEVGPGVAVDAPRKALSAVHQALMGQQRWSVYSERDDVSHQRSFRLLNDMHQAVKGEGFRLMYQPKLDLHSGEYKGAEALLRWDHAELGAVPPMEFIPLVEKTALITPLTDWVMRNTLAEMRGWHARGYPVKIAINFSARNFEEPRIAQRLHAACVEFGIEPRYVEIEATEGVWMESPSALRTMHEIRELGMGIALDDFGTGYSNFSYLQQLPATVVKLDQSLIRNLCSNPRDQRIVRALITLAKGLDYRVVVEGVETRETLEMITEWGADEAQGYLLDKPLTPLDFERRLMAGAAVPA